MAAARKKMKAVIDVSPQNSWLWIVQVSLVGIWSRYCRGLVEEVISQAVGGPRGDGGLG